MLRLGMLLVMVAMPARAESALTGELAFVRLTDGYWQVWRRDLASGDERQLTHSGYDKRYPEWGADGALYFRSNNDELYLLPKGATSELPFRRELWPAIDPAPAPGSRDKAAADRSRDSAQHHLPPRDRHAARASGRSVALWRRGPRASGAG